MVTNDQLTLFCAQALALRAPVTSLPEQIVFERGRKNARIIVQRSENDRWVWAFIDLETGNILKPAGWKAPARYSRGNIRNGVAECGPSGPAYLR